MELAHILFGFSGKNRVEQFLGRRVAVKPICRVQELDRSGIGSLWEKRLGFWGKPIDHFRTSNRFRSAPGIHIALSFEFLAMLLHAHVTQLKSFSQLIDRQTLGPFQGVNNTHPLRTANLAYSLHRNVSLARPRLRPARSRGSMVGWEQRRPGEAASLLRDRK